jgi:hypothetical protein
MGIIMSETSNSTVTLESAIEAAFPEDQNEYSPYALIELVNELLEQFGSSKHLPTQMGYNYVNNGLIKGVTTRTVEVKNSKKGEKTRTAKFVNREGAMAWALKFVSKNVVASE